MRPLFVRGIAIVRRPAGWVARPNSWPRSGSGIGGFLMSIRNAAELIIGLVATGKGLTGVVRHPSRFDYRQPLARARCIASRWWSALSETGLQSRRGACLGDFSQAGGIAPHSDRLSCGRGGTSAGWTATIRPGFRGHRLSPLHLPIFCRSFHLVTHRGSLRALAEWAGDRRRHSGNRSPRWPSRRARGRLSEVLVRINRAADTLGFDRNLCWGGRHPFVRNAAEHSTAVWCAWKNKMDLSLRIATGSSLQIALSSPMLVLASYALERR